MTEPQIVYKLSILPNPTIEFDPVYELALITRIRRICNARGYIIDGDTVKNVINRLVGGNKAEGWYMFKVLSDDATFNIIRFACQESGIDPKIIPPSHIMNEIIKNQLNEFRTELSTTGPWHPIE